MPSLRANKWAALGCSLLLGILVAAGCNSESDPVEPGGVNVNVYFADLPGWSEYCPPVQETQQPEPTGSTSTEDATVDVESIDENGVTTTLEDVHYSCTNTEYDITKNPEKIVMFGGPNIDILWPGALIQGASHRDGVGALLPLTINQRAPIHISIPALATADNFREVAPNQHNAASAIGDMIGTATLDDLSTPSSISYDMKSFHSEEEFALSFGVSGRYLGFSASASGSHSESVEKTTVAVRFHQKMYEAVVAPPQTPGDYFSDAFTSERLQEQVDLGRIGPDNPPVYVSKVVYGRMLMYTLTSTASATEIMAAIDASYESIEGGGSAHLSDRQTAILQSAEVTIASLGGEADDVLAIIRSGNIADYFDENPALSTAEPMSYTFKNLGDGSTAMVGETTRYTQRECRAISMSTTFGGEVLDEDDDNVADRFCPQHQGGNYDFGSAPTIDFEFSYSIVDSTEVECAIRMKAYRGGDWAESTWYTTLFTAPEDMSIQSIDGSDRETWAVQNSTLRTGISGGYGLSGFEQIGIATVQWIGDTSGNDIAGECNQDQQGRTGIWSLEFDEIPVQLTGGKCLIE